MKMQENKETIENMDIENKNKIENLIGILLLMPLYMVILVVFNLKGDNLILFPTLMYLPIIIGTILSYIYYYKKIGVPIGVCSFIFLVIAVFFFIKTYCFEYADFEELIYYLLWLLNTAVLKIFLCVLYSKIVGKKKAIIFFIIYVLAVVASFVLGFWA